MNSYIIVIPLVRRYGLINWTGDYYYFKLMNIVISTINITAQLLPFIMHGWETVFITIDDWSRGWRECQQLGREPSIQITFGKCQSDRISEHVRNRNFITDIMQLYTGTILDLISCITCLYFIIESIRWVQIITCQQLCWSSYWYNYYYEVNKTLNWKSVSV